MNITLSALSPASVPEGSRETLSKIQKSYGFVPNMMATFANSPAVLNGYAALEAEFQRTSFQPAERTVIFLAASVENSCGYCIAAHSTVAKQGKLFPVGTTAAIRAGELVGDDRLIVLAATVRAVVRSRGYPAPDEVDRFLAAGYTPVQLMELLVGIALKTISNYTEHLFHPELDAAFEADR